LIIGKGAFDNILRDSIIKKMKRRYENFLLNVGVSDNLSILCRFAFAFTKNKLKYGSFIFE
jgi:hypothetical protein